MACLGLVGCALAAQELERYPSPDGQRALVVRVYNDWIDPMYPLQLDNGWFSTIDVGCVNGDYSGINSVTWADDRTVHLDLSDGGNGDISFVLHLRDDAIQIVSEDDDRLALLSSC